LAATKAHPSLNPDEPQTQPRFSRVSRETSHSVEEMYPITPQIQHATPFATVIYTHPNHIPRYQ